MSDEQPIKLRADARRNRDSILSAAKQWFNSHGPEAPAEEIARTAGLAPGTLYRHFPDREALIRAVVTENFKDALDTARTALAEEPTAWDALVRILHQSHEMRFTFRLLVAYPDVHAIMKKSHKAGDAKAIMSGVLSQVVARAQEEGSLRTDVGAGDIAVMFALLAHPLPVINGETATLATERCLSLLLEGLRPGSTATLPGRPITTTDLGA